MFVEMPAQRAVARPGHRLDLSQPVPFRQHRRHTGLRGRQAEGAGEQIRIDARLRGQFHKKHERGDFAGVCPGLPVHGNGVQVHARTPPGTAQRGGTAPGHVFPVVAPGQRAGQQRLQRPIVGPAYRDRGSAVVRDCLSRLQQRPGTLVGRQDTTARVQLDDAASGLVQQRLERLSVLCVRTERARRHRSLHRAGTGHIAVCAACHNRLNTRPPPGHVAREQGRYRSGMAWMCRALPHPWTASR